MRPMLSMSRALYLAGALLISSPVVAAELCALTYETWQDLFRQIQSNPKLKEIPSTPGFKAYSAERGRTWTITAGEGSFAHPSVACRSIVGPEGNLSIETRLVCFSSKPNCDRLAEGYRRLDEQMNAELK